MTLTAVMLLLVAAGTHAAWNALGKHAQQTPAFLLVGNTLGALCLLPALMLYGRGLAAFSAAVWGWIALTGLFQAVYYVGLAGAYRAGDMSVAYPLLRSLPVLLVALANLWLGRADQLSRQALLGMLAVVVGGVLLPVRRFPGRSFRHVLTRSTPLVWGIGIWVLAAALGTTGYSLIDDQALRIVRSSPALVVPSAGATAMFALFEGLAASSWLGLFVLANRSARRAFADVLEMSLERKVYMRDAAYLVAIDKVVRSMRLRGWV